MGKYDRFTDRDMLDLRAAVERERMSAHRNRQEDRRKAAAKKLREIDNELDRRRAINRGNRARMNSNPRGCDG